MTSYKEKVTLCANLLLEILPEYGKQAAKFGDTTEERRNLLHSLMNICPPKCGTEEYFKLQDEILAQELKEKNIVTIEDLSPLWGDRIYLWRGDITRLKIDAIVNAANSKMLGCFCPCHNCIDNAIHSAAGLQLRDECNDIMRKQGYDEPTGWAKITKGYNLPAKYVIHTVGPIVYPKLVERDAELLRKSYASCLSLAKERDLSSMAFCCISTGEFNFPQEEAALIAIDETKSFLSQNPHYDLKVIFNVFKEEYFDIYRQLLR